MTFSFSFSASQNGHRIGLAGYRLQRAKSKSDGWPVVDRNPGGWDNRAMQPSVEQLVEEYKRASESLRREIGGNPEKIRDFFISAGILKPDAPLPPTRVPAPSDARSPG